MFIFTIKTFLQNLLQMKKSPIFLFLLIYSISLSLHAQVYDTKMFIFGHSLIDHRPPATPTPSNETTVPHWMYLLCQEAGTNYAAGGQYGFLPQHANVPPIAQWGYDIVPGVWESDTEPFSAADITTILITAGNFMQWQAPNLEYPGDPGITPISATETVVDWVAQQEDGVQYYIYENWPDMAGFMGNGFPPTQSEFVQYDNYTQGEFHDWWIDYQDALLVSRPDINIRMIPVGQIIGKVLFEQYSNSIPFAEIYEDDAPHGRPTLYFLASLVTYMGIYQEKAPSSFNVPNIIHQQIRNNYTSIVDFIWYELQSFNDNSGESRVFYDTTPTENPNLETAAIYPNPVRDSFYFDGKDFVTSLKIFSMMGVNLKTYDNLNNPLTIDVSDLQSGVYILELTTLAGKDWYKLIVE